MAKTKLNKFQLHYLETNPDKITNEEMAKELGVSVATVYNYLKKNKPPVDINVLELENQQLKERVKELETPPPIAQPSFDGNIGKAYKKGKQMAVIMTPNASEFADDTEKAHRGSRMNEQMANAIHNPKTKDIPRGPINK